MIVFFGDSLTYGYKIENKSKCWPFLLAKTLGHDFVNLSISGATINTMHAEQYVPFFQSDNYPNVTLFIVMIGTNNVAKGSLTSQIDTLLLMMRNLRRIAPVLLIDIPPVNPSVFGNGMLMNWCDACNELNEGVDERFEETDELHKILRTSLKQILLLSKAKAFMADGIHWSEECQPIVARALEYDLQSFKNK
ncbi:hypothetical protein PCE1_002112 [Barthelona sp. PCE]